MSGTTEAIALSNRDDVEPQRTLRLAAIGDLHYDGRSAGSLRPLFAEIQRSADMLVLCGDMTTHGRVEQMRGFVEEMGGVTIPIIAVLGNHDVECGQEKELTAVLVERGVNLLTGGEPIVIEGIGFAGTKGFAGGFGRGALAPFGEKLIKDFVQHAIDEAIALENGLRNLPTDTKVAVLHYSPIAETLEGEPEIIFPFLGSSRLVQPIDTLGATVVFHGHAHHGRLEGSTPGGVPVRNVARPVLEAHGLSFLIYELPAPERRREHATDTASRNVRGMR